MDKLDQVLSTPGISYLSDLYQEVKNELDQINEVEINAMSERITLADLIKISFDKAKKVTTKMTLTKRIKLLNELDAHLVYLYHETKGYDDQGFGKSKYGPKEFMKIMGKIKHLEILQTWLYGID
jgi:hypothetical protein